MSLGDLGMWIFAVQVVCCVVTLVVLGVAGRQLKLAQRELERLKKDHG